MTGLTIATVFVQTICACERSGGFKTAAAVLLDTVDTLFRSGEFGMCDEILAAVDVDACSHKLLVGFLSASFPGRQHLQRRTPLLEKIEARFRAEKVEDVDGLLFGLR